MAIRGCRLALPSNVFDGTLYIILHGEEEKVYGDSGYVGVGKRKDMCEDDILQEREKASIHAKVKHPFLYVKRIFDYGKTRYKGLAKNHNRLALLLSFFNLLKAEKLRLA